MSTDQWYEYTVVTVTEWTEGDWRDYGDPSKGPALPWSFWAYKPGVWPNLWITVSNPFRVGVFERNRTALADTIDTAESFLFHWRDWLASDAVKLFGGALRAEMYAAFVATWQCEYYTHYDDKTKLLCNYVGVAKLAPPICD